MKKIKKKFIKFAIKKGALKFGKFYLKSGNLSPYFFNSSVFYKGKDIIKLSKFYAKTIINSKLNFNLLFGLSYKGIPILISTVIKLLTKYNLNISYCFNRKEKKKYGEKGILIGKSIHNKKIIILDDVITAGKTIKKIKKIITNKTKILAICTALNRKEHNINKKKIISIINIEDIIKYFEKKKIMSKELELINNYYQKNCIK